MRRKDWYNIMRKKTHVAISVEIQEKFLSLNSGEYVSIFTRRAFVNISEGTKDQLTFERDEKMAGL